jgi:hypothetical protein
VLFAAHNVDPRHGVCETASARSSSLNRSLEPVEAAGAGRSRNGSVVCPAHRWRSQRAARCSGHDRLDGPSDARTRAQECLRADFRGREAWRLAARSAAAPSSGAAPYGQVGAKCGGRYREYPVVRAWAWRDHRPDHQCGGPARRLFGRSSRANRHRKSASGQRDDQDMLGAALSRRWSIAGLLTLALTAASTSVALGEGGERQAFVSFGT